jgi:hypothetical protein
LRIKLAAGRSERNWLLPPLCASHGTDHKIPQTEKSSTNLLKHRAYTLCFIIPFICVFTHKRTVPSIPRRLGMGANKVFLCVCCKPILFFSGQLTKSSVVFFMHIHLQKEILLRTNPPFFTGNANQFHARYLITICLQNKDLSMIVKLLHISN